MGRGGASLLGAGSSGRRIIVLLHRIYNNQLRTPLHLFLLALFCIAFAGCSSDSAKPQDELSPQELHGQRIFRATCAVCHHDDSTTPLKGPGLKGVFRKKFLPSGAPANDERVRDLLIHGRRDMPAYGNVFGDRQMDDIIAYLHAL
jgi:mono/diheme cytochrome c family protein